MGTAEGRTPREDEGATDEELLARARAGDSAAFALLYARHDADALRLARILAGDDAGELVSEAAARVLTQIRAGRGPVSNFRAYLHATIRNRHRDMIKSTQREEAASDRPWLFDDIEPGADHAIEQLDGSTAAAALTSLPEVWQRVLWHLEVEGRKTAEVAALLDMTPAAVSSLAYRAREGLRQAYLTQHVPTQRAPETDAECAWVQRRLGRHVRGIQSAKHGARVGEHLSGCAACTQVHDELVRLNRRLAAAGWPLVLAGAMSAVEGPAAAFSGSGAFVQELAARAGVVATGPAAAASGVAGLRRLLGRGGRGRSAAWPAIGAASVGLVLVAGGAWALAERRDDPPSPRVAGPHRPSASPQASPPTASAPLSPERPSKTPHPGSGVTPPSAVVRPVAPGTGAAAESHHPRRPKPKPKPVPAAPVAVPVSQVPPVVVVIPLPPTAHPITACDQLGSLELPQTTGLAYAVVAGDGQQGPYTVRATPLAGYAVPAAAPSEFTGDLGAFHACTASVDVSLTTAAPLGHRVSIATTTDLGTATTLEFGVTFAATDSVAMRPSADWQCLRTDGVTPIVVGTVYSVPGRTATIRCSRAYSPGEAVPALEFDLGTADSAPTGSVQVSSPEKIYGTFPF